MRPFKSIGAKYTNGVYVMDGEAFVFPNAAKEDQIFRALCGYKDIRPGFNPHIWEFVGYDVRAKYMPTKHYTLFRNENGEVEVTNPQRGCIWDEEYLNKELVNAGL